MSMAGKPNKRSLTPTCQVSKVFSVKMYVLVPAYQGMTIPLSVQVQRDSQGVPARALHGEHIPSLTGKLKPNVPC